MEVPYTKKVRSTIDSPRSSDQFQKVCYQGIPVNISIISNRTKLGCLGSLELFRLGIFLEVKNNPNDTLERQLTRSSALNLLNRQGLETEFLGLPTVLGCTYD